MKGKIILFFIIIGFNNYFYSQNIVPNWSFEAIDSCNFSYGAINIGIASPWDSPSTGSPDLFNTCAISSGLGVPLNTRGYEIPHFGNGYAGVTTYLSNSTFREYLQVQLDSILVSQRKYCVSFYINLAEESSVGTNNFGMYLSTSNTYVASNSVLSFIPQLLDTNIIIDTTSWTLISGEYIATGGEKYIILGNFNLNVTTDTLAINNNPGFAFYYVDDVSIVDCTGSGLGVDEISNNNVLISPNPTSGLFTLSAEGRKIKEIKVTNLLGQEIITTTNPTVNLTSQPNGIYFVKVETDGSPGSPQGNGITTKKVVKQ